MIRIIPHHHAAPVVNAQAHAPSESSAIKLPQGAVGWAGPTTEPALGSHDRKNTTDLPEEIEAAPDKSMSYLSGTAIQ